MITYEDIVPSSIENTTMQRMSIFGVPKVYVIKPFEGYKLHDKHLDYDEIDPITNEGKNVMGYTEKQTTCEISYDFVLNPRELYAVIKI